MKKLKKSLLSVLLFSFAFLVAHDFTMPQVKHSNYNEVTMSSIQLAGESLSFESEIHESIHNMLALDISQVSTFFISTRFNPSHKEKSFSIYYNFILERPPLS